MPAIPPALARATTPKAPTNWWSSISLRRAIAAPHFWKPFVALPLSWRSRSPQAGGIRSLDDARSVIRAGADKITINTAAVERPELIRELSGEFGSQAVVLAIDAKRESESATPRWERAHPGRARLRSP